MTQEGVVLFMGGALAGGTLACFLTIVFVYRRRNWTVDELLKKRKDQFISLASHYFLTPITVIQTAVSTLQEKGAAASLEQREVLYDNIDRGRQRLWILVQQLIVVGEIDFGRLQLQMGAVNVFDAVTNAVATVDTFAREKKVTIGLIDNLHEVREARLDQKKFQQALLAILDNAVKFSLEEGSVAVRVGFQSGIFSVEIEDQGVGMPDAVLGHITERFYRGTDAYTFDYEGVGLGLHVAYAIIAMHGGSIVFESKPSRGTIVRVQIPGS